MVIVSPLISILSPAKLATVCVAVALVPLNVTSVFVFAIRPSSPYTTIRTCSPSLTIGSAVAVLPPIDIPVLVPPVPGTYVNISPSITRVSPERIVGLET